MLKLVIPAIDAFDDEQQLFVIMAEEVTLELEHSLVSLSKWEATWEKPFLSTDERTVEETLGYIQAMCLTPDVPSEVYQRLSGSHIDQVNAYIDAKMSATWFNEQPEKGNGPKRKEIITAEIIYYWMISFNIPFECQHWHLNRLFSLIKVCNQKNAPEKKQGSKRDMVAERNRINAERKAKYGTKG